MATLSDIQNLLDSPNWPVRSNAVRSLEKFPIQDSLPILDIAIKDKEKHVRQAAIELMDKLKKTTCFDLLEFCLTDSYSYNRELAFRAICKIYQPSYFPLLEEAINRKGELMKTRMGMIWELRHLKDKAFVPILLKWIPQMPLEPTNIYILLEVIITLSDPRLVPIILKLGKRIPSKDVTSKIRVATILGHLKATTGLDYILDQVGLQLSTNNYSDSTCLKVLSLLENPAFLLKVLDQYKGRKHNILVEALGLANYQQARPILEQKLARKTEINACLSLAKALQLLNYQPKDKNEALLFEMAHDNWVHLKKGSILAHSLLQRATKAYTYNIARTALELLGKMGDKNDVEILCKQVTSSDSKTRIQAIVALGKIKSNKAIPTLVRFITKNNKKEPPFSPAKEEAVRALGKIGDFKVIPFLIELLQDNPSMGSQSNASAHGKIIIETLVLLHAEEAIPAIVNNLSSRNHIIRTTTVKALQQLNWQPNHLQNKIRWFAAQEAWKDIEKLGKLAVKPLIRITENDRIYGHTELLLALARIGDQRSEDHILRWLFLPHYQIHALETIQDLLPHFTPLFHELTLDILLCASFIDQELDQDIVDLDAISYSYSLKTAIKATQQLKQSELPLAVKALTFLSSKKKVSLASYEHEEWGFRMKDVDFEEQKQVL